MLIFSGALFSQNTEPPAPLTKEDYLKKSKGQRIGGKVLLAGGAAMYLIALVVTTDDVADGLGNILNPDPTPDKNNEALSNVLFVAGTAAIIGSVPLLLAAGRNKRKAALMSFKMEKLPVIQQQGLVNSFFPALSISIPLSR